MRSWSRRRDSNPEPLHYKSDAGGSRGSRGVRRNPSKIPVFAGVQAPERPWSATSVRGRSPLLLHTVSDTFVTLDHGHLPHNLGGG